MTPGGLKCRLPVSHLQQVSHRFVINRYRGRNQRMASTALLTCAGNLDPLLILQAHEVKLGQYSVAEAEIAFDVYATSIDDARERLKALIALLDKPRHQRRGLRIVHKPDKEPPPGCLAEPTIYFEDRKSGVRLKCYIRQEKVVAGEFGELIVRLEWTLKRSSIVRHLGGQQIGDLLQADLNGFLKRNLRLKRANHLNLGKVLRGYTLTANINSPPGRGATAFAYLNLRRFARQEHARGRFPSLDHALAVCQFSPAQIRGYLRELRDGKRRKRGRQKLKPKI